MADVSAGVVEKARHFASEGRLVEAGWMAFRNLMMPEDATDDELAAARTTFISGAKYLFTAVNQMLDDGPTTKSDEALMRMVALEMDHIGMELQLRMGKAGGHA